MADLPRGPASDPGVLPEPGTPARFGVVALAFLVVTFLSGALLLPFYDPAHPMSSLEEIQGGHHWTWFVRGLHCSSALGLTLCTLLHGVHVVLRRRERRLTPGAWVSSIFLLPLIVMVLLGGFIMKGDGEATAALHVWRGILDDLPLVGERLSLLLLGPPGGGLATVSLHHCGTFTILLWLLSAHHGRRLWPAPRPAILATLVCVTLAGLIPFGLGAPPGAAGPLLGPWYLLGLQGALLHLPPWVGWIAPALFLLLLLSLRWVEGLSRRLLLLVALAGALVYGALTAQLLMTT